MLGSASRDEALKVIVLSVGADMKGAASTTQELFTATVQLSCCVEMQETAECFRLQRSLN